VIYNFYLVYHLLDILIVKVICILPYSLLASQTYSPLSVILAEKITTLSLLVCGQDEQVSGMDQLNTGYGEDDTVQLSTTCSLIFATFVLFCSNSNSGGPITEKIATYSQQCIQSTDGKDITQEVNTIVNSECHFTF